MVAEKLQFYKHPYKEFNHENNPSGFSFDRFVPKYMDKQNCSLHPLIRGLLSYIYLKLFGFPLNIEEGRTKRGLQLTMDEGKENPVGLPTSKDWVG